MLISKELEVKWYYKTRKHYEDLGYVFTKYRDSLIVPIEHLHENSTVRIKIECDYCGCKFDRRYADHTYIQNKNTIGTDACEKCSKIKLKESMMDKYGVASPFELKSTRNKAKETFNERYGVDNPFELEEIKEKIVQTNLDKYGVEYYTQTDEYKQKAYETNMERYGVDNPSKSPEILQKIKDIHNERFGMYYSQTDEFKEKYKQTCMDRYGVENAFQSEEVKQKIIQYNLDTYGVEHPMKIKEIAEERISKMFETKYKNGTHPSSRQQDYLGKLLNGEINYPYDRIILDVLLENNIYLEYDGSGHNLRVQFGDYTQEEFEDIEMKRKYYILSKGFKEIRIISLKDFLPSDEIIKEMLENAKIYFNKGHSWIKYDIDNGKVICSQYEKHYDFGELRKITEDILQEVS